MGDLRDIERPLCTDPVFAGSIKSIHGQYSPTERFGKHSPLSLSSQSLPT